MADVITIGAGLWEWLKGLGLVILAILGWNVKRQVKRIDDLEKNSVNMDTFNRTIKTFREDLKEHNGAVLAEIHSVRDRVDKIMDGKNGKN